MRDWSKAEWVDPAYNWKPLPVPEMPERLLMDFATRCNLRCPMCLVWGVESDESIEAVKGVMALENARKLLSEFTAAKPMVAPSIYGEPLLIPYLRDIFADMKRMGFAVVLNTNGLTLTDSLAEFFCEIKLDSIMFSIDSTTPETLKKVRGVDKLDKIEDAVRRMLKIRGPREHPRIGVSFTKQETNKHEADAFVERWSESSTSCAWASCSRTAPSPTWSSRPSARPARSCTNPCPCTMTAPPGCAASTACAPPTWAMC